MYEVSKQSHTLFGEEVIPEQINAIGKSRAKQGPSKKTSSPAKKVLVKKEDGVIPMVLDGWTAHKQYYSIGEVAALLQMNTSHIRFWTNEFSLKVRTTKKGDRLFSPEQIKSLGTIHHLVKEKGFTLSGAKARLKENKNITEKISLKQALLQLRNQLQQLRTQLG